MRILRSGVVSAMALSAAAMLVLVACEQPDDEASPVPPGTATTEAAAVPAAPAAAVERARWTYPPVDADATAIGALTVMLPPNNEGQGRTYTFASGETFELELTGLADIAKPVGAQSMAQVLGVSEEALKSAALATYLLKVKTNDAPDGATKACGGAVPAYLIHREPSTATDKTVVVALLTAAPEDKTAVVCKKLTFTSPPPG